jgi:hypothetical protein
VSLVYSPGPVHHCGPNEYGHWRPDWDLNDQSGTVRQCCDKTWVAYKDDSDPGYMGIKWRRESWWQRRKRATALEGGTDGR